MNLRVLDLFSGIGGFSLGLERTGGFETVAFCEIEPFPRRVLAKHWPGVPCYEDVTSADFGSVGPVELVTAGFPCQDISFAGAGAGLAGERSGLFWHIIRTVRMVGQPKLLLENVAGLLNRGLAEVLGALASIGYDAEWHCIPASAIGAPHRRDRIWIVADPGGEQHEGCRPPLGGQIAAELSRANSDTASQRCLETGQLRHEQPKERSAGLCEEMADAERGGQPGPGQLIFTSNPAPAGKGQAGHVVHGGIGNQWSTEPDVGRVAHGVPDRSHRLAALGNSVVPQIPELIGRAILEAEAAA